MLERYLLAAVCVWSSAAEAQDTSTVKGWTIETLKDGCSASAEFDDGTSVTFSLDQSGKSSDLIFWNDKWKSIDKDGKYSIGIAFDGGSRSTYSGSGMRTDESGGIYIGFDDLGILPAAMSARRMSAWNDDKFIGSYNMAGSNAAILAVAGCSGRLSTKRVDDPFAK